MTPSSGTSQILVPARALAELQRLSALGSGKGSDGADDADGAAEATVGLSIGDHDVTFTAGDVKVSTRLLDGTYPDYRQLIPAEYPEPTPRRQGLPPRCAAPRASARPGQHDPGPAVDAARRRRSDRGVPGGR